MTSRAPTRALLGAIAALAAAAPAALADDVPPTGGTAAPESPPAAPAPVPVETGIVSVDGPVHVVARAATVRGRVARFRGTVDRSGARRRAVIQRFDDERGRWRRVARARVHHSGHFVVRWRTDTSGEFRLRAVLRERRAHSSRASLHGHGHRARTASQELDVTVYEPATATWYGPGFFGNRTACGQVLTRQLIGVAHRHLPCGTPVELFYDGRTLVVPVVDRGPYRDGADWDLTQATARALGMEQTDTVGALPLR